MKLDLTALPENLRSPASELLPLLGAEGSADGVKLTVEKSDKRLLTVRLSGKESTSNLVASSSFLGIKKPLIYCET